MYGETVNPKRISARRPGTAVSGIHRTTTSLPDMKNLKILLIHELQQQTKSFTFLLMAVIAVFMAVFCGYVQVGDFVERQTVYNEECRKAKMKEDNMLVYSQFEVPVIIAPNPLSIFVRGNDESIGNKSIISPVVLSDLQSTSQRRNSFLALFSNLDIAGIVKLLSLFALLLAAGLISGERERKTFNLIFSNAVSKKEYFLAKITATSISSLIPLILVFLIAGILVIFNPMIYTSGFFWLSVTVIFILSFFYLLFFISAGIIISSSLSNAGASVLVSVLFWITLTFIYPNLVGSITDQQSIENQATVKRRVKLLGDEAMAKYDNKQIPYFCPEDFIEVNPISSTVKNPDGMDELNILKQSGVSTFIGISQKCILESTLSEWENFFPLIWEYQNDIQSLRELQKQELRESYKTNLAFTGFLPDVLFERASSAFANTLWTYRDEQLSNELRTYRSTVMDYIRKKNGFSEQFFTQLPRVSWKDNYDEYTESEKARFSGYDNYPKISLSDVPVFTVRMNVHLSLDFYLLIILDLILITVGFVKFQRFKH
jgi:ABC-type transport system involved in multi-copper enzyme maturation permease subunit